MMKCLLLSIIFLVTAPFSNEKLEKQPSTVRQVLEKVRDRYDPNDEWDNLHLRVHIREPRPKTPERFSNLTFDNQTDSFSLSREVDEGTLVRLIDQSGRAEFRLNDSNNIPVEIQEKYRLSIEGITGYFNFYHTIHGLPATLNSDIVESFGTLRREVFKDNEVHVVPIGLKDPLITLEWELLVAKDSMKMIALRFIHPPGEESENEIILFEGEFEAGGVTIPRFRHWYIEETWEYLGSDILLHELPAVESKM